MRTQDYLPDRIRFSSSAVIYPLVGSIAGAMVYEYFFFLYLARKVYVNEIYSAIRSGTSVHSVLRLFCPTTRKWDVHTPVESKG